MNSKWFKNIYWNVFVAGNDKENYINYLVLQKFCLSRFAFL